MMGKRRGSVGHSHHHTLKTVRAVVLGKDGVGKSALTVRFLTRRYIGEYDSKLEATYRHHLIIDSQFVSLDIMDTAGKNSTEKMQMCISFAELFFVLYSTTDRTSFEEASLLTRYILQDKSLGSTATVVIVGTKTDLGHLREVEEQEGRLLAKDLNCGFYQVSNSEGYLETQELLLAALKCCLDKNKSSPLSRVKEGLVETAKSFRWKSVGHEASNERETPKTNRRKSVESLQGPIESPKSARPRAPSVDIPERLRTKSSSQEDLTQEKKIHRNSVASTSSF